MIFLQCFSRPTLFLCLAVLPFLLGKAVLRIWEGKRVQKLYMVYMADAVLTGWLLCIGMVEAVHLAAIFGGWHFSDTVKCLTIVFILVFLTASAVLFWGQRKRNRMPRGGIKRRQLQKQMSYKPFTVPEVMLFLGFVLLLVYQLVTIASANMIYRTGDLTVETVESFIGTDAFYQVNPLTGRAYETGVPFRLKILCLPTAYGFLCKVSGLTGMEVVWKIIPVITLFGSYLAGYVLAGSFFPGDSDRKKRMLFMLFLAVLFCMGDYMYGMDGFDLLYSGFRGVTIRNTVLLPYTIGLILRRRRKSVLLCVLAEACIVWTFYGMGVCLLTALIMSAMEMLPREISRRRADSGEEAQTGWNG